MSATGVETKIPVFTQGDRLRKARQLTGLTTREFADDLGVSQATITNAENDNRTVRRITLKAWSMRTGVPLEWLETGVAPHGPVGGAATIQYLPERTLVAA